MSALLSSVPRFLANVHRSRRPRTSKDLVVLSVPSFSPHPYFQAAHLSYFILNVTLCFSMESRYSKPSSSQSSVHSSIKPSSSSDFVPSTWRLFGLNTLASLVPVECRREHPVGQYALVKSSSRNLGASAVELSDGSCRQ